MFENVKEWTFMSLPLMWVYATYAGSLPKVTDTMVDATVVGSALVYVVANRMFVKGYIESADKRLRGFRFRSRVVMFWLFGSAISVTCSALQKYGALKV